MQKEEKGISRMREKGARSGTTLSHKPQEQSAQIGDF